MSYSPIPDIHSSTQIHKSNSSSPSCRSILLLFILIKALRSNPDVFFVLGLIEVIEITIRFLAVIRDWGICLFILSGLSFLNFLLVASSLASIDAREDLNALVWALISIVFSGLGIIFTFTQALLIEMGYNRDDAEIQPTGLYPRINPSQYPQQQIVQLIPLTPPSESNQVNKTVQPMQGLIPYTTQPVQLNQLASDSKLLSQDRTRSPSSDQVNGSPMVENTKSESTVKLT